MPDEDPQPLALREPDDSPEFPAEIVRLRDGWPGLWVVFTDHLLAQYAVEGKWNAGRAYQEATGLENVTRQAVEMSGKQLLAKRPVIEFLSLALAELHGLPFDQHVATYTEKVRFLTDAWRTPVTEIFDPETGAIREDKAHLVERIKRTLKRDGSCIIEVWLVGKAKAIEILNRMQGHDGFDPLAKAKLDAAKEDAKNPAQQLDECLSSSFFVEAFLKKPDVVTKLLENPEVLAKLETLKQQKETPG